MSRAPAAAGRGRVLVIEDDPAVAALLAERLALDGLEVESAPTGELGLERAMAHPPDVILLDIGLPGELDGWQVLVQLKTSRDTKDIPVVVCTGTERAAAPPPRSAPPISSPSRSPATSCATPCCGCSRPRTDRSSSSTMTSRSAG